MYIFGAGECSWRVVVILYLNLVGGTIDATCHVRWHPSFGERRFSLRPVGCDLIYTYLHPGSQWAIQLNERSSGL